MARADRRRAQRTKAPAPVSRAGGGSSRKGGTPSIEDTMFFPKLRRHAKWMFVLLALVFGLGFVVFGVGAGGIGIGDVLRGGGGASGSDTPSVKEARAKIAANKQDAQAYRDLATALQADGKGDASIEPLEQYVALKPKDTDVLRELAGLYLAKASRLQQDAQIAQLRAQYLTGGSNVGETLKLGDGQTAVQDPVRQAVEAVLGAQLTKAYTAAQEAYASARSTYERLGKAAPDDANIQIELAQVAEQTGDRKGAIAACERFLKLAPDDPSAPIVKQQIKQLKAAESG